MGILQDVWVCMQVVRRSRAHDIPRVVRGLLAMMERGRMAFQAGIVHLMFDMNHILESELETYLGSADCRVRDLMVLRCRQM